MSNNERDTHFLQSSEQVWKHIRAYMNFLDHCVTPEEEKHIAEHVTYLISQYAYDLVLHAVWNTTPASGSTILHFRGKTCEEIAKLIPDMESDD